jgi:septal ring factor EnvC (AmiA/AmiB activator)
MMGKWVYILLAVVFFAVSAFSFYLYVRQTRFFAASEIYREAQEKNIEELKGRLDDHNSRLEKFHEESVQVGVLIPQIKNSIAEIKSVIAQSRVEASMIKDDAAQWKKDYVAVLIELEERLNGVDIALKALQEERPAVPPALATSTPL